MGEKDCFIVKKTHQPTSPDQKIRGNECVFLISKKIFKTAVARNKIKRQIRAILRDAKEKNGLFTIILTKNAAGKKYKELKEELLNKTKK